MAETKPPELDAGALTPFVPLTPPVSSSAPLPTPLSEFIERQREVAALRDLLLSGGPRLVTLTGPGGVGKTRLALRLATELAPTYADGVAFVPLAAVADPDLVPATVAQALGVRQTGDGPVRERLSVALRSSHLLLVLDNVEHLLPAAGLATDLLSTCPGLNILATSRTTLRLSGEHAFPVPPMALPAPGEVVTAATARQTEAVQLFAARARAAMPSFTLSDENAADVTEICRRLDGLPLAIELAAVRVPVLPPRALLARLDRRLPLLTGGPRDAPERLKTVRGAIAWSHDQLTPDEQTLFRRLAVFAGGCTLEAAEAVAGDGVEVLDGISALIAASLLQQRDGPDSVPRYVMLETIREYGLERLAASGEEASVHAAHAAWCVALAESAGPFWYTSQAPWWVNRLESDHDNLRAALVWLTETSDRAATLRLIAALSRFWGFADHWVEGYRWQARGVAWSAGDRTRQRVDILNGNAAGWLLLFTVGVNEAQVAAWCAEALEIAREIGDADGEVEALAGLAAVARSRAEWNQALRHYEAVRAVLHDHADTIPAAARRASWLLGSMAAMVLEQGDYRRATTLAEDAFACHWELQDIYWAGNALLVLAAIAYEQDDLARAVPLAQEALDFAWPETEVWLVTVVLDRLAIIAGETGQAETAASLGGVVERLHQRLTTVPNPLEQADRDRARATAFDDLGEDAFASVWAKGRAMSIDEAVTLAKAITIPAGTVGTPRRHRTAAPTPSARHGLSPRELEVVRLVAAGHSNRQVADALFISVPTVKRHLTTVLGKLDLPSRSALTAYVHTQGLLERG